jgi:hypothetical protein
MVSAGLWVKSVGLTPSSRSHSWTQKLGEGNKAQRVASDERRGRTHLPVSWLLYWNELDSAATTKEYKGFLYAGDTPGASLHTGHCARTAQRRHEVRTTRPPLHRIDATHTTPPNCLTNSNVIPQLSCTHTYTYQTQPTYTWHTHTPKTHVRDTHMHVQSYTNCARSPSATHTVTRLFLTKSWHSSFCLMKMIYVLFGIEDWKVLVTYINTVVDFSSLAFHLLESWFGFGLQLALGSFGVPSWVLLSLSRRST